MKIKDLSKNYGCFIISFIILLYFIILVIFSFNGYYKLKKEITNIFYTLKSIEEKTEIVDVNNKIINKIDKNKIKRKHKKRALKNNFITNSNGQENDLENNNNNNKIDSAREITQNNKDEGSSQKIGM
jgi:hypothetical protein